MKTLLVLVLIMSVVSGCNRTVNKTSGEDSIFLEAPTPELPKNTMALLPIQFGNTWEMLSRGNNKIHKDSIRVLNSVKIDNQTGFRLQLDRDGILWRQEVYQNTEKGLFLLAFGEKKRDLLVLSPPFPLAANPVHTGNQTTWTGNIRFGKQTFKARGYTRVTCIETVQTNTGRFQCYRIDSVITMNNPGTRDLHFPTIRWLNENTGFVQRSFADEGKPALQILEKFKRKE